MSGASSEKKDIENRLVTLELVGYKVKKKNAPPGYTAELLVAMRRHQYDLFIVVVKLSIVERRARRR